MNEEQLIAYIQEVTNGIFDRIATARNLGNEEVVQQLLGEILGILDQMGLTLEQVIPEQVIVNYFGAVDTATKLLSAEGVAVASTVALTPKKTIAKAFQKKIHMEAVEEIMSDTLLDLKAAIRTAKGNASTTVEKTLRSVQDEIAKGIIAGDTNKVIRNRLIKEFQDGGLTSFKTKDNKNLPVDYYSKLVVRTKLREANTKGANNRYLDAGVKLIKVSEHGVTCPVCAKYEGMVICIEGEMEGFKSVNDPGVKLPPYHPHCYHTTKPFVIEYKSEEEIKAEKKRSQAFNPDKDTRTAAQKREYRKEQEIRRKANEEKKQYARWKALLGDDAPKTIGGFRRMKRENTKNFQKLQSKYRSLSMKKDTSA